MFTREDVELCINAIKCEDADMTIGYAVEHLLDFFTLCFKAIEKIRCVARGEKNISFERAECLALIEELRDARCHKEKNGLAKEGYNNDSFNNLIDRIEELIKNRKE